MMNKLIAILTLFTLTLSFNALAQPEVGPPDRPGQEREFQRDRGERSNRPERPERPDGDRPRTGERDGERGDWRGKREPLSVDQVEEAIATIRAMHGEANPSWLQRIEAQAKENPEEAAKHLSRFPRIHEMMDARKNNPEEFELHTQQSRLMRELFGKVRELRQAQKQEDPAKVDELRPQVRERVEQIFQVRLELKELEIRQIREKLAEAEQELTEIKADSDKLIDEKMNELMQRGIGPRGPREEGERREREERRPKPDRDERSE